MSSVTSSVRTYLAIGAHIGDMDLTAGPLLAAAHLAGHRTALLALTPGERGHPRLAPAEYRRQKLQEGQAFAAAIGAQFHCFDDLSDGFLGTEETTANRIASLIRQLKPDVLIAHWRNSIHTDHAHASWLAERARFLAGLPTDGVTRHGVSRLVYAENWEDMAGFEPSLYVPIPDEAFEVWREAIAGQAFARGETYGFRYIDYYTALMTMRGCLARTARACAFATEPAIQKEDLL
jgi:LmbE family N-acetylglucosaminyl deacetylase